MSNNYSTHCRRKALTLIEVVASMALMSTLLVSSLVAFGRHERQMNLANQRNRAIDALESTVQFWFSEQKNAFPLRGQGQCADDSSFFWVTRLVRSETLFDDVSAFVVEVSIYSLDQPNSRLFSVELLQTQDDYGASQ